MRAKPALDNCLSLARPTRPTRPASHHTFDKSAWLGKPAIDSAAAADAELEIAITATYEDGTEVYSGTYMPVEPAAVIDGLEFGKYTVAWPWAYAGGGPASGLHSDTVEVKPGKTVEFAVPGGISITQAEVDKDYVLGAKGVYDEGIDDLAPILKTTLTASTAN